VFSAAIVAAAPVVQQSMADITEFTTSAESVFRTELDTGTARIPVSWAVDNRPDNSNLVFEQVLADGSVVNVELPRDFILVPDTGEGVVAPRPPGGEATTITLRVRLIDLGGTQIFDEEQLVLNIVEPPPVVPEIEAFETDVVSVNADQLEAGNVLVPVSWSVLNRPANSNLVFEQILADGSVVNVELPRDNLIVPSSGVGVVAPRVPGGDSNEIVLQMRFVDLGSSRIYGRRELRIGISETPVGNIRLFEIDDVADRARLAAGTERLTVRWDVNVRPTNSNIVFEQVLADGRIVNIELPRDFVIIESSGTGTVAPQLPGDGGDTITVQMRLVDLETNATITSAQSTVAIEDAPQATISAFTAGITQIDRAVLATGQARVPVTWEVQRRPSGSNLVFEQVLPDGSVNNVELPRSVVLVPSSGNGVVVPQLPQGEVNEITLQVRLIDIVSGAVFDRAQITLPIVNSPAEITTFTSTVTTVSQTALENGSARLPVTWQVSNRPENSNLVFEQLNADGTREVIELPRENPIVPSSGTGVVAPTGGTDAGQLVVQLTLFDLATNAVYDTATLNFTITTEPAPEPRISVFSTSATSVQQDALAAGTARVPVSWAVVNRPQNSNLAFEQILPDGTVANIELPRDFILVPTEGTGSVAPRSPGAEATEITLRVRLFDIGSAQVYDQRELTLPVEGTVINIPADTGDTGSTDTGDTADAGDAVDTGGDTGGETNDKDSQAALFSLVNFSPSVTTAAPGETITVTWEVQGATVVTIREILADGTLSQTFSNQPPSGSLQIVIPANSNPVTYTIEAEDGTGQTVTDQFDITTTQ